ncbi:U32 family peptidase [Pedobacter sp. BS3]|uniref:peptidase U32 family protein n=1 Tax=Pedobacter sp. BS3 TaxID=2567937 RepID=UPI0011EEA181|nr:peptidase U32 family protein [Pedobacter sp. BS3]TZF82635.1 U32 family peptidase [Pedobacter sp. BS3]
MKNRKVELLSPAGSFECLQAAINAGADAIYFGVEQLNMRAKSVNSFSVQDIKEISSSCKASGIKSYITLNTVMYDHDMQLMQLILKEVKKQQIDAVIAADFAVINYCNRLNIPLHISTQANVSNIESVQFFSGSSDLIVLARELTLRQIAGICKEIKRRKIKGVSGELMKIEVFVHGALCMAVSGKCYLSLHSQNSSANRGACAQECRHPYKVTSLETNQELIVDNEYIMSPKDLCTIGVLDQLVESGADVFKIEGRSKGPDYVFTVTQCYREAIDAIAENTYTPEKVEDWMKRLSTVYNRGFWEGYYLGHKLGEWTRTPGSIASEKKVYIGRGSRYYPKIKVGEFLLESGSIKPGDTLMITGPKIGVAKEKIEALIVNGLKSEVAAKGDRITFPVGIKISPGDKLYKIIQTNDA